MSKVKMRIGEKEFVTIVFCESKGKSYILGVKTLQEFSSIEIDFKNKLLIPLLKEQFNNDVGLIHASLIDLLENEYLDKEKDLLVAKILELIHTEEGLPPCSKYRCKRQREMLHENQDKKANV